MITEKAGFVLCGYALTSIAPVLGLDGLAAIGELLLLHRPLDQHARSHQSLFNNYDLQLGASQFPDPIFFALLLLLSKNLPPSVVQQLQGTDLKLKNPWLQLAPKMISHHDIPDESGMLCHDHQVNSVFAALSLLQYLKGEVTHCRVKETLSLASSDPSRELAISLPVYNYLETVISSYSNPLPSLHYPSSAVHALFNPILPDDYLCKGWTILHEFMDGFEKPSVQRLETFAEAFFATSGLCEKRQNSMQGQEPEFIDGVFSGLDWMAMAWSLHLSQQSGTKTIVAAKPPGLGDALVNEEFALQVLSRLINAAPCYSIYPIIPKLHEFVAWFDDANLLDYQSMVSASIEGAEQEFERCYKSQKFHCAWYL